MATHCKISLMNIINKFKHLIRQIKNIKYINWRLKGLISNCGLDNNIPFIELITGEVFYGFKANHYQKRLFFLFNKSIKSKIKNCKESVNLLYDISFRFIEPETKKKAYDVGKYYDIEKGDVVLELGAYIGMYAVKMQQIVGETGKVIAVEAIKNNFEILQKNIEKNNITNIIPVNKAIWNEKGKLKFYSNIKQDNSAIVGIVNNEKIVEVESDTIDNIVKNNNLSKVDFIRIQINGAEKNALEGMKDTFKFKPVLMVTVAYKNKEEIANFLRLKGYNTEIFKYAVLAKPK